MELITVMCRSFGSRGEKTHEAPAHGRRNLKPPSDLTPGAWGLSLLGQGRYDDGQSPPPDEGRREPLFQCLPVLEDVLVTSGPHQGV